MIAYTWENSDNEKLAIDDLNAIYAYVRAQRINSVKFPAILPLIAEFEGWYGGLEAAYKSRGPLGTVTGHVIDAEDVAEAKRRREAINQFMGQRIPGDWVPADSGQTPPDKPETSGAWVPYAVGAAVVTVIYLLMRS